MEHKEKNPSIDELLARKRKLTNLRDLKLKLSRKQLNEKDENNGIPPGAPFSNEARSITPPPFSPLTPLIPMKNPQDDLNPATPSDITLLKNIFNDDPTSPLPIMSPATQKLYDVLITDPKLQELDGSPEAIENSDVSDENEMFNGNSDDSVKDPDFEINTLKKSYYVGDSETDCESIDDSTLIEERENLITQTNGNQIMAPKSPEMNEYDNAASTVGDNLETREITQRNGIESNEDVMSTMEVASSNEQRTDNNIKKRRSRKQRIERKLLRNTGKSYVSENGKVVPARKQKDLSPCRLKCAERFTTAEQMQCFENYWQLGTRDRRASFISKSITILPKKTEITGGRTINRNYYCKYNIEVFNVEKPICKECLSRILGETKGFINVIMEKKKNSPLGVVNEDQRGLHPPKNKKTVEDITHVKDHILSFPSYESHYCRKSTGKRYLPADLSINKMYRDYKNITSQPVSLKLYSKCFHDLNLSFKKPAKDTCNTCDVLNAKIKVAKDPSALMADLVVHQNDAEKAYAEKRSDKEYAKTDPSVRVFTFDLQQCLPTPYLKTSVSFYKRQLWSFNLTIHDLASNEASCYMWDETIGARGANQIASCLWHFCHSLPPNVKEIIFYSDTCGGQNKNNVVAMMFMFLLYKHPTLQTIHHKFLISGHSHMECDSDHAIIEKTKKKTQMKINHLNDWVQLVRTCKVNKPFKTVTMTLKDFMDFSDLKSKKGPFAVKKINDSGDKFLWQPIKWLKYEKNNIGKILYKTNLNKETPFESINFKKRGKTNNNIELFSLRQISNEALPISAEKKRDLMDLLDLIDDAFKDFYREIKTANDIPASLDPDLDEDDADVDVSES